MQEPIGTEPWMRGSHPELDALRRGVVHALELAMEDGERWAAALSDEQMEARPAGLPSVGWQLRHTVRSLDRLLTYAEDCGLNEAQFAGLRSEAEVAATQVVMEEFRVGMARAVGRVAAFRPEQYEEARGVGRRRLPTTVGGLLVHCAEHTQRHAGQMVTTAKVVGG